MNWFQNARLAWIKESVEIFGFINRDHICRKFGVSVAQAAVDLRSARELWPDLIRYDASAKRYVRGEISE